MVMMIVALLLILGFAFYQSLQGLFSTMIMAMLTILCAAVAFNFYEPLGQSLVEQVGAYAYPAGLILLFAVPLIVLRFIFDSLIRGTVMLDVWIDRIGGAAFGLITALVVVGMLTITVQMLPFPAKVLTYQPYNAELQPDQGGPVRWAGHFVLGLMKHLSAGSLRPVSGGNEFGFVHPDLLREEYGLRNRPTGGRTWAPPKSLEVTDAFVVEVPKANEINERKLSPEVMEGLRADIKRIDESTPQNPLLSPITPTKVLAIRVRVDILVGPFLQRQRQFDPFVVRQFQQETGIALARLPHVLQVAQELLCNLGEERRLAAMLAVEIPDQRAPAVVFVQRSQHRKIGRQQGSDVVEKKLAVDFHPPVFDSGRCGMAVRIPDVRRKCHLQRFQALRLAHGSRCVLVPAIPVAGCGSGRPRPATPPGAAN